MAAFMMQQRIDTYCGADRLHHDTANKIGTYASFGEKHKTLFMAAFFPRLILP
jgi:methylthioribose-1-phosphate isomerase